MDVWGFAERHKKYPDVTLDNLDGYIAAIQNTGKRSAWEILPGLGGTNNEPPVMNEVIDYFKESTLPVFVVCITDGGICKTREIKEAIRRSANYPVFWKFVGLGGSNYGILERLDTFSDRRVDNSNFLRSIILPTLRTKSCMKNFSKSSKTGLDWQKGRHYLTHRPGKGR